MTENGKKPLPSVFGSLALEQQRRLKSLLAKIDYEAGHFLGYPCTRLFDYSPLYPFLGYPVNNVGDPYNESNYHLNTHEFEREVVDFFAKITRAEKESIWGYVTNGGTEGNLYGIYLARELFNDGIVYYSEDTHYSVAKILRMLHVRNIMIKSQPNGEIDYQDLAETINIHRDCPPIIFANIGSTMKGAVDNLDEIRKILKDHAIERHYIHADAALGGMILPFVDSPQPFGFDAGIDSISISGHKMVGSPIPCGVVLARKAYVDRIARGIEYIGTLDTTVSGSRNGITPLFLWYAIQCKGIEGFKKDINHCLEVSAYALRRFQEAGINQAWQHENSITVVFPKPEAAIISKWQLASHGDWAHVVVMPHVEKHHIDALLADISTAAESSGKEER